ncbi:hypothetical protein FE810_13545 [Thalassotalea litorea]|uniref:Uncharacterized protein n=1 Tax=Thalassotalea litorea TaxID=2020715 RepID=A0A5R9IKL8_9GAMM|nr:hypothetical protein [Thalassotalea litorea]TLU61837.1 hypothetical protein FE810_13545 [Thalassotalea litorea]
MAAVNIVIPIAPMNPAPKIYIIEANNINGYKKIIQGNTVDKTITITTGISIAINERIIDVCVAPITDAEILTGKEITSVIKAKITSPEKPSNDTSMFKSYF